MIKDKEYEEKVDYFDAEVYLRAFTTKAKERKTGIFIPEVMIKFHLFMKRRDMAFLKARNTPTSPVNPEDFIL